jgi:hypothetical protein
LVSFQGGGERVTVNMKTMNNAKDMTGGAGKSTPKGEKNHSLKGIILWIVCACILLYLTSGCGAAATPAAPAPATAAPAVPPEDTPSDIGPLPTSQAATPNIPPATAGPQSDIFSQLNQIDVALRQQIRGSIAYNKPESMTLGQTATIELLLSPSLSKEQLGTQVTENGAVQIATIEITPRMKAVLLSPLEEAFIIQPIHEEVQLISASETTQWAWFVTAKKSGTQRLVLVLYRLVKYEGQDYWREVETYKADIKISIPFAQRVLSMDWKWIISILVALLSLPFFWRWSARRRRKA